MAAASVPKRSESDVYDRQIRLWGAEAQEKISKAKVLYIHLTGVSSEVLKNLVLAGVHATLCDARPYPDAVANTPSFFLLERQESKKIKYESVGHAMKSAVEELNPLLGGCDLVHGSVQDLDDSVYGDYDIVVASRIGMDRAAKIAKATIAKGGKFYLVDSFGWNGCAVVDLGKDHVFRPEKGKDLLDPQRLEPYISLDEIWRVPLADITMKRVDKTPPPIWLQYRSVLEYHSKKGTWPNSESADDFVTGVQNFLAENEPTLKELPSFQESNLKEWAALSMAEMSPVCAVMGGVVGNEIIKAISGKGEPANNVIIFDGIDARCRNILVKRKPAN